MVPIQHLNLYKENVQQMLKCIYFFISLGDRKQSKPNKCEHFKQCTKTGERRNDAILWWVQEFLSRTDSGSVPYIAEILIKKKKRQPFSPMWQLQLLLCAFSQSWQKSQNNMINDNIDVK